MNTFPDTLLCPHSIFPHILPSAHISTLYHTFCELSPPFVEATWPWGFTSHVTLGGLERNAAPIKSKYSVIGNIYLVEVLRDLLAFDLALARKSVTAISGDSLCSALKQKGWGIPNDAERFELSALEALAAPCSAAQAVKTLVTYGWTLTLSRWPVKSNYGRLSSARVTYRSAREQQRWLSSWKMSQFLLHDPRSLGSIAHHARFCGGARVSGWVIWSIQFCLCTTLQHNSLVVADLSEWANASQQGVTEHLENTNSQSGWLGGRINVSLGFSAPLIRAFKCVFAIHTYYRRCGEQFAMEKRSLEQCY